MRIEVIVAAMFQKDFSLIDQMNLNSNVVIANQGEFNRYDEIIFNGNLFAKMISTSTKGVGLNRNIGLSFSGGDILMFSDQDVVFKTDYVAVIEEAFTRFKKADVIVFGAEFTKNGEIYEKRIPKFGRLPFYKSLKYGTYSIAIKRNSLLRKHLNFSQLFGGGCLYSHGEDSDFIIQCYKNGLKVYSYGEIVCQTSKDTSTCFEGYNEKYFFDTGALAEHSFKGIIKRLYLFYISHRIKDTNLSVFRKRKLLSAGRNSFLKLQSYSEYLQEKNNERK